MSKPAHAHETDDLEAFALAETLRGTIGKLNRRLREEGNIGDVSFSQSKVLLRLERSGPATVTTLAEAEGIRPQSMSGIVSALKAAGMIDSEPDPTDGRQSVLSLSEKCRKTLATARNAKQDWLFRALQSKLTPAEQQKLAGAVALLDRLLEA